MILIELGNENLIGCSWNILFQYVETWIYWWT